MAMRRGRGLWWLVPGVVGLDSVAASGDGWERQG
jgi:hypothetical protein